MLRNAENAKDIPTINSYLDFIKYLKKIESREERTKLLTNLLLVSPIVTTILNDPQFDLDHFNEFLITETDFCGNVEDLFSASLNEKIDALQNEAASLAQVHQALGTLSISENNIVKIVDPDTYPKAIIHDKKSWLSLVEQKERSEDDTVEADTEADRRQQEIKDYYEQEVLVRSLNSTYGTLFNRRNSSSNNSPLQACLFDEYSSDSYSPGNSSDTEESEQDTSHEEAPKLRN